ncbi:MAG: PD-(D/E)XK nuclease family protein [Anaerolineae bacterium]|nr:PD-(D/E)XK nuclease family protein [Anaerolineae bacterium]
MVLPKDFQFSQSSLQDFATCPRRFELHYLQRLSWPASEAEPVQEVERLARLGADFHRLVQQHLVGINADILTATLSEAEPELQTWWQNYLDHHPALDHAQTYPELTLSTPLRNYRLLARFDLLARQPDGVFLIVDWKTTRRKPARDYLAGQMQTRIYPYVLVAAGTAFNKGQPVDPATVQMMYWYPQVPAEPEVFEYSKKLFRRDEEFLSQLVEQVKHSAQNGHFPLVEDRQPCRYCVYRSFCDRGDKAGPLLELAEEPQEALDILSLDWDQIAEIEF